MKVAAWIGCVCLTQTVAAQAPAPATLTAGTLAGEIQLDGRLTEPAWSSAPAIDALTMVEPNEGGRPTGITRVIVLATAREILIGIDCQDPDPSAIVSFSRERDADLQAQDHIKILFDTFLAGRSGYVFAINASGARYDALVTGDGRGENRDWDAAWESAVAQGPTGWSAEIRIPVRSLSFRDGASEWGFNVERRIQRGLETNRWASPLRDARVSQPSRAGRLVGLPRFTLGIGLSVRPAMTTGIERTTPLSARETFAEPSLDVSERIGANLLASLTFKTDFAETEVDARRSNLTRFPLFFPEKRTFFQEGADNFDFGLQSERERSDLIPFFTRRIGLHQGVPVPLAAGGKVNGRIRGTSFAALAVRTGTDPGLPPAATISAVRIRQDLLRESYLGVMATAGDPQGRSDSWMVGSDFTYRTSRLGGRRNLLVGLWALATGRDSLRGQRTAYGAGVEYPNDVLDAGLYYKRIGDGFDPSLGFVPRRGAEFLQANFLLRQRQPVRFLRDLFYELRVNTVLDRDRRWESYVVITTPVYLHFESGDVLEFNIVPYGERLAAPFDIAPGVAIPAGSYQWVRYRLEATAAAKRKISGRATWWFGTFYDGSLHQLSGAIAFRPSASLSLEATLSRNAGHLPNGDFTQEVLGGRIRIGFTQNLQLNSFLQYDNLSRLFGTNTRLRWQFHPLGELFLVFNRNVVNQPDGWSFDSDQLLAKLQYAIRL